jgi:N-acetyl-anhydromuramyl-L-alanine amidase AmpD
VAKPAPPIQNIIDQLKRDPSQQFPARTLDQIQMVIIHHTAVAPTVGVDRIAAHRVDKQGWPGIGYHYFITFDGQIQQTNELTTIASHAGNYNAMAIGICFAGDFTTAIPTQAQIEAGAQLISWLLDQFKLPLQSVFGYKELVNTQSPGLQWDSGARWGDQLRERIQANL